MTDREFLRRLRHYARKQGLELRHQPGRGKGSHSMIWIGMRSTILREGELQAGLLRSMLRDLDIPKGDF